MAKCSATGGRRARPSGFTYIGLLIAVAILGVVSAGAITAGSALQRRSHEAELLFIGEQFRAAFQSYYDSTPPGHAPYPASLAQLLKDPRLPATRRHLRRIYADPLTGKAQWGTIPAPGGGIAGIHSLAEGRPIKISGFPPAFASFEGKASYSDWIFSPALPAAADTTPRQPAALHEH